MSGSSGNSSGSSSGNTSPNSDSRGRTDSDSSSSRDDCNDCNDSGSDSRDAEIQEAKERLEEARRQYEEAVEKMKKAEKDIELLDKAIEMLEQARQELKEAMNELLELVQSIDHSYSSNMQAVKETITAFIHNMVNIMISFDAEVFLTSAMIDEIVQSKSPAAIKHMIINILSAEADRKIENVRNSIEAWEQAVRAQNPNLHGFMSARLNAIVEGNQVERDSPYFRDAAYNSFTHVEGQCTWFAEGRARELTGIEVDWLRNDDDEIIGDRHGRVWADPGRIVNGTISTVPSVGSIVVWGAGVGHGAGHVGVVERIVQNGQNFTVLYSHANTTGLNGWQGNPAENSALDGRIDSISRQDLLSDSNFLGFVHLHQQESE